MEKSNRKKFYQNSRQPVNYIPNVLVTESPGYPPLMSGLMQINPETKDIWISAGREFVSDWINITAGGGGGGTYTVDNGLTETPANNFRWGGSLLANTTITNGAYNTLFTGAPPTKDDALLTLQTTAGLGTALSILSNKNAIEITSAAVGIIIEGSTAPFEVTGTQTSKIILNTSITNTVLSGLLLSKSIVGGSAANGSGISMNFSAGTNSSSAEGIGQIAYTYTDVASAPINGKFIIIPSGTSATASGGVAEFSGDGSARLNAYGIGTYVDQTPAYGLGVDSNGNIVETAAPKGIIKQVEIMTADETVALTSTVNPVFGLQIPVLLGYTYSFRIFCGFDIADTNYGTRWSLKSVDPAPTYLGYSTYAPGSTNAAFIYNNSLTTFGSGPNASGTTSTDIGNMAIIEGLYTPSEDGTLRVVVANENQAGSTTLNVKAGSYIEYYEVLL